MDKALNVGVVGCGDISRAWLRGNLSLRIADPTPDDLDCEGFPPCSVPRGGLRGTLPR